MKSVLFLPSGNINAPSSRLICYENAKYLRKLGWNVSVGGNPEQFDIIIFQKRLMKRDRHLASRLKGKKIIVFQLSEAYYLKSNWQAAVHHFAQIANASVVSTSAIAHWFKKHHKRCVIIPTGLDFAALPKGHKKPPMKICWIGSAQNEKYLKYVVAPLNRLWQKYNFEFRIIGARMPSELGFKRRPNFIQWHLLKAEKQVSECHIGIAPLDCAPYEFAKPPSKPVLYMAQGLAVVATNTPSYRSLIKHGTNGYLIKGNDTHHWTKILEVLLTNSKIRNSVVAHGLKSCQPYNAPNIAKQWDVFLKKL